MIADIDVTKPIDCNKLLRQLLNEPDPDSEGPQLQRCIRCKRRKELRHFPLNYRSSMCTSCATIKAQTAADNNAVFRSATRKRCGTCRQIKDHTEFHRQKAAIDGLQSQCKVCKKASRPKR